MNSDCCDAPIWSGGMCSFCKEHCEPIRDESEGETLVEIKTLCTRCQKPMICSWPEEMTFGGEKVSAEVYMAKTIRSKSVLIACDKCLSEMPDVKLEDLKLA